MSKTKPILGVLELPASNQTLSSFGLYRIGVYDPSVVTGCFLGCINANTIREVPLACVFSASSAPVVSALRRLREQLGLRGQEQIFRLRQRNSASVTGLDLIDNLLRELKRSGVPRGSLVLFSHLDEWIPDSSERLYRKAIQRLHAGLKNHRWIGCSVEYIASSGQRTRLLQDTRLAGIASISTQDKQVVMNRPYWSGLRHDALQPLELKLGAHALCYAHAEQIETMSLEGSVIAQTAAWPADVPAPANWVLVEKPSDMMRRVAVTIMPACILAWDEQTSFDTLTRYVHAFRMIAGSHASIYVREVKRRLRAAEQMILARIGMNALLPETISTEELCRILEQSRGQEYIHDVARNFETALKLAADAKSFGYLKPAEFIRASQALMAQGLSFNIEASLVFLPLRFDVGHVTVLENLQLVRHGDVATVDERGVYIYLHGCSAEHVDTVMQRAFRLPLDQLFEGHVIWTTDQEMERALMLLQQRVRSGPLLDYALLLGNNKHHSTSAMTQPLIPDKPVAFAQRTAARPISLRAAGEM